MADAPNLPAWRDLISRAPASASWLAEQRAEAAATFVALGFPTRRHEDWRYLDLASLTTRTPALARPGGAPAGLPALGEEYARVVLQDGRLDPASSRLANAGGVHVRPLAEGLQSRLVQSAMQHNPYTAHDGISALQRALAGDGVWIDVDVDADPGAPVHVVHAVGSAATPQLDAAVVVITCGRHSRLRLVETWAGGSEHTVTLDSSATWLEPGAQLEHTLVQALSHGATWLHRGVVSQARDSRLHHTVFALGAQLGRDAFEVEHREAGAETTLNALYSARDGQVLDHHTVINHAVPNGRSSQLYKGVLSGTGRGVFNGRVFVRPGAQQTNAQQLNQNLLLSADARVDTKPQLEIFADDVKCSHGATIGQLDPESLFYLQSRAISPDTARRMLVDGFAREIAEAVPCDTTRVYALAALDAALTTKEA